MEARNRRWGVLGAGSWGTALAVHLARAGHPVRLWTHLDSHFQALCRTGANEDYLPGVPLPPGVTPSCDLGDTLGGSDDRLLVVPSEAFRSVLGRIRGLVTPRHRIAWGTKGFGPDDRKLLHQVAREQLGPDVPLATVSGPTFAREVARGLPCALVIASDDAPFARDVAKALQTDYLLPFTSRDLIGVQVGGAVKNVIAIAAGIADGLGFGSNARAALITRGLHEITRLGQALGAARETFVGLSGLGDLVLTCSDDQSRNRRFGLALGRGASVAQAHAEVGQVVEGMTATAAVHHLAREQGLELPICGQVHQVVRRGRAPSDAVRELLSRPPASERA